MDISIPGLLSMATGVASILCWGNWYAAIPIILTIVLSLLGVSDDLKYRWPAVLGALCASVGVVLMCLNLIPPAVLTDPEAVQEAVDEALSSDSENPDMVTTEGAISDWVKFVIDTKGIASVSFPKEYVVLSKSGTYNINPEYSQDDINAIKNDWLSDKSFLSAFNRDANCMIELFTTENDVGIDVMNLSDDYIKEMAGEFAKAGNDDNYNTTGHSTQRIGNTDCLIVEGNYNNGSDIASKDYFFNRNNRVYCLKVSGREGSAISDNNATLDKIVETIEFMNTPETVTVAAKATSKPAEVKEEPTAEPVSENKSEYLIGETWTVPGQWSLTVTGVRESADRNEFSDKNPAAVYNVTYRYENLGYEDELGLMDGLYFDLSTESIIDSSGQMGYSYPGSQTNYSQETPVGAYCEAEAVVGVDHAGDFTIKINKYDGPGNKHSATFKVNVNQ